MKAAFLTQEQVAILLGETPDWFCRHKQRLIDDHGFPPPVPGFPRPRWDPVSIERWRELVRPAHLRKTPVTTALNTAAAAPIDWEALARESAARIAEGVAD